MQCGPPLGRIPGPKLLETPLHRSTKPVNGQKLLHTAITPT
jgi:hypothetical protein